MSNHKQEKGAAVVEFAVLVTLLIVFLFGIFEFGFIWLNSYYISNSAREGARVAAKSVYEDTTAKTTAAKDAATDYLKKSELFKNKCGADKDQACTDLNNFDSAFVLPPTVTAITKTVDGEDINFIKVSVTVNTAEIWEPILFPLINALGRMLTGEDQSGPTDVSEITGSASYAVE